MTYTQMTKTRSLWFVSFGISILLIGLLLWVVDLTSLNAALGEVKLPLLLAALVPLTAEALITSKRIQYCADSAVPFSRAVYSNAWYVLWLGVLPARLGEVAGIGVFKKVLGMSNGSAIASIVVQRIYDLTILSGLLVLFMSQIWLDGQLSIWIAVGIFILLVLLIMTLPFWLSTSARCLYGLNHRHRIARGVLRIILQAKSWYRSRQHQRVVMRLVLATLAKWLVNLVAVLLIFSACHIQVDLATLLVICILIHFLGAIPIQSVGGFGVVEVGLTGLLVAAQVPVTDAVAASLMLRMMSLGYAAIFFISSFILLRSR